MLLKTGAILALFQIKRTLPRLKDKLNHLVTKKLSVSPFPVEDTGDPMGGDGLFIDLTDAPDGVGLSLQNSANGTESSNSDVSSTLSANENQSQSSSLNMKSIIRGAKKRELSDSVEVLKYLPKKSNWQTLSSHKLRRHH